MVIAVDPGRAKGAAGRIIRVVDTGQLAKSIVLVGGRYTIFRFAGDIAAIVISIGEVHRVRVAALRYRCYEGSGRICAVGAAAGNIGVRSGIGRAVRDGSVRDAVQLVVGIAHLTVVACFIIMTILPLVSIFQRSPIRR